jgi:IS30 family transposase
MAGAKSGVFIFRCGLKRANSKCNTSYERIVVWQNNINISAWGERSLIQTQLLQGFTPSAIAKNLSRSRSCISRELARNVKKLALHPRPLGRPPLTSSYCSVRANDRAHALAVKPRVSRKLVVGNALWVKVRQGLESGLSPEQVAGLLWRMDEPISLSHETIYRAIYVMPKGELRTEMIALLRQGHNKRRPRSHGL